MLKMKTSLSKHYTLIKGKFQTTPDKSHPGRVYEKKVDHAKMAEHLDWFRCPRCETEFAVNQYRKQPKQCNVCGNTKGLGWRRKEYLLQRYCGCGKKIWNTSRRRCVKCIRLELNQGKPQGNQGK